MTLEKMFDEALINKCKIAQAECVYNPTRFLQTVDRFGGVRTVREIISKGKISEGFDKLQQANRLDLTMEATVIEGKYGQLFTDDEVNSCYELLCEFGYY